MRQCIVACRDAGSRTVGIGLFTACVAVAVDGFFSGNFVMPISQMWIAFLFGWSIAWCRSQQPVGVEAQGAVQKSGPVRTWAWRGLALAALASQVWLIADVYPEATHLSEHLEHVQKELAPNPRTNPRFWSHGWF